jgi:hypothetical protein
VATTCSGLIELEPHLIDERKKQYVEQQTVALALVGAVGLIAFGLVELFEVFGGGGGRR